MRGELGYLDTNIFVHHLYPNDRHYSRCRAIVAALEDGSATGWLDATIVYELTFILARGRRLPNRRAIAEYVQSIIAMPGVKAEEPQVLAAALERWAARGVGFADAWLFARALADGRPICSVNARDFTEVGNTFFEQ
jgi:predicted nucleic acid-binding protein